MPPGRSALRCASRASRASRSAKASSGTRPTPPPEGARVSALSYRRVLLKVSGEALMGPEPFGLDEATLDRIAREIAGGKALGAAIGVVVGGGNMIRGATIAATGIDRVTGDYMGMLATVMNGLALHAALERAGVPTRVLSAIPMPSICETYTRQRALRHFEKGRVVLFAGGTGNPFFTTDTTAALRAAEMDCKAILKATQVDGVYTADPKRDPSAKRYDRLSYGEALARDLKVMDAAAIALARDNRIPIIVFSIREQGSVVSVLRGAGRFTVVSN